MLPLSFSVIHAATNLMHSMNCFQTSLIRLSVIVARTPIGRVSAMTFKKRKENAIRDDLQSSFYWHVVPIRATWHIYIYISHFLSRVELFKCRCQRLRHSRLLRRESVGNKAVAAAAAADDNGDDGEEPFER